MLILQRKLEQILMTRLKDIHGMPIILGDTVFYDGHYTVKQNEDGQYYLKSHHKHKTVTDRKSVV